MANRPAAVLFLCTGNSARSLMAEAILRHLGGPRFEAHSAGTHPKAAPHPLTLEVLADRGHDLHGLSPKNWDIYARPGAPSLAFVFSVCDDAHGRACPVWPGQPLSAHWGVDDPAAANGSRRQRRLAFERAYEEIERRVRRFTSLTLEQVDRLTLSTRLAAIGAMPVSLSSLREAST